MSSGRDKIFLSVAAAELAVVFLLPWAAAAAAGAWRQGLTYFGPIMIMVDWIWGFRLDLGPRGVSPLRQPASASKQSLGAPPASRSLSQPPPAANNPPPFAPPGPQTAVNISLEAWHRKALYVLAVYSSTGANNLWRLCAYFAGEQCRQPAAASLCCCLS